MLEGTRSSSDRAPSRPAVRVPAPTETADKSSPGESDAAAVAGLAAGVVLFSSAACVWLLVHFVQWFVQPELTTLHEQIAGIGFH